MSSGLVIRSAQASEREILEALQWRASLNNPGDRDALLANPDAIALPVEQIDGGGVFVAEADGAVLGFAAILLRADGDFELDALFVEPSAWKRGIGRALTEHCATVAGQSGAAFLHVIGNPHAEGFYTSCQFMIVGTQSTRFGTGLLMKRDVARPSCYGVTRSCMSSKVETVMPPNTPTPIGPYSHVAKVGEFITIGGTAGFDPVTNELAGVDVGAQTTQILKSFRVMLESVGSDLDHVIHINVFLIDMRDFDDMNRAYVAMMGDHRPARTVVGVNELPKAGVRLTMNLTAVTTGARRS